MIVGAQKAGTTSLKNYLGEYPEIMTHREEEITFFVNNEEYAKSYQVISKNYFNDHNNEAYLMGKSVGIMYSIDALKKLYQHNPDIKLVVVLRDPVDRAYSAYWYARRKGWENIMTFEEAINADPERHKDWVRKNNCAYLDRGEYAKYLKQIFSIFPEKNVRCFLFNELKKDANSICDIICKELLNIEWSENLTESKKKYNSSSIPRFPFVLKIIRAFQLPKVVKDILPMGLIRGMKSYILKKNEKPFSPPKMSPATRKSLYEFYFDENQELEKITGLNISHWKERA